MDSLDDFAAAKLAALDRGGLRRALVETERGVLYVERNGRRLLSFSCNDYLNFTQHPEIKAAAIAATERYGVGSGASRLVTGNHPLYTELEARLSRQRRHHPGADRVRGPRAARRAVACLPVGRRAPVARDHPDLSS